MERIHPAAEGAGYIQERAHERAEQIQEKTMKYIIMCGGHYEKWKEPRQLIKVNGECLVERTIRLLRENGIEDIAISSDNPVFTGFGVPLLIHDNDYYARKYNDMDGYWCNCFYPMGDPACYLMGDVLFSPEAIRTIVKTKTDDIMLFGSKAPFAPEYPKEYREPFAFKVSDQGHLHRAIQRVKRLDRIGAFLRKPIAWELWSVIRGTNPNRVNKHYVAINDYTCDVDNPEDIEKVLENVRG